MTDFTAITELPGTLLTAEQQARIHHRYALARHWARGTHLLEAACGAGSGLGAWSDQPERTVMGLDCTGSVLAVAQADVGDAVPLVQADAQQLPISAGAYDTVFCFEALYYMPDAAAFVAEARRVLRPGGLLLIGQANPGWPAFVPGALSSRYHHAHELAGLLTAGGFQDLQLYGAFPTSQTGVAGRLRNRLRSAILRMGLLPTSGRLAERLKRAAYGALTPLPPLLPLPSAEEEAHDEASLARLDLKRPDHTHRVLYIRAER